mmetsp:Transcript_97294/g.303436  ORF Transcript_97294/g.303436 Transcript_97294/m.303436 type:complete len:279 (+) Transcript_97294:277-1113(+)
MSATPRTSTRTCTAQATWASSSGATASRTCWATLRRWRACRTSRGSCFHQATAATTDRLPPYSRSRTSFLLRSYKWFRSQYHLVRKADKKRLAPECLDGTKKNIVLAIRKGDDPKRGFKAETYLDLLGLIFGGKIERTRINSTEARVVVISEAEEADRDMVTLRKSFQQSGLPAKFLLGKPEEALEASQARLVRDMDCMALSDVLVLSDSGFSDVGAVVQQTGVALMLHSLWRRNVGLPNTEKVSKYGQEQVQVAFETSPGELPNQLYVDVSLVSRED